MEKSHILQTFCVVGMNLMTGHLFWSGIFSKFNCCKPVLHH